MPVPAPTKPGIYYSNQEYLLIGCLFGLIILAILTTFTLKRMMFFLPLFILVTVQTVYRLTVFILQDAEKISQPNHWVLFFDGLFEAPVQFYLIFLSPLNIANKYRFS